MQRRNLIRLLGGAAVAWPFAARAQQSDRVRRIGVLMAATADDPDYQARIGSVRTGPQQLAGAMAGTRHRHALGHDQCPTRFAGIAAELAALAPDVILAGTGTATVAPLLQATRTVPIVFTRYPSTRSAPVFVASLARPGGNADWVHGFRIRHERKMAGAAEADRARSDAGGSALRNPTIASGIGQFAAVQAVAPSLG